MKMKIRTLIAGNLALILLASLTARAAEMAKYYAKPGSKMRIEGTSNINDWQVESPLIGGYIEVGAGFPTTPGQAATPGKMEAGVECFVPVNQLRSRESDGKLYSDAMDAIMYEKLLEPKFPRITYHLTGLTLKEAAKTKDAPYVFEAKGDLAVAGVTNSITMPVNILVQTNNQMKVTGSVTIKMTSFKIDPPAPKVALGLIKTGDDVKLIFDWNVAQRAPAAAAKQ
jgi:hypothetical protein